MAEITQIIGLLYIIPASLGMLMPVKDGGMLLIASFNLAIGCVVFYLASTPFVLQGFILGVAPLLFSGFTLFVMLRGYFIERAATRRKFMLHDSRSGNNVVLTDLATLGEEMTTTATALVKKFEAKEHFELEAAPGLKLNSELVEAIALAGLTHKVVNAAVLTAGQLRAPAKVNDMWALTPSKLVTDAQVLVVVGLERAHSAVRDAFEELQLTGGFGEAKLPELISVVTIIPPVALRPGAQVVAEAEVDEVEEFIKELDSIPLADD